MIEAQPQPKEKEYISLHEELKRSKPAIGLVFLKRIAIPKRLEREVKSAFDIYSEVSKNVGEKLGEAIGFTEVESFELSHSFARTIVGLEVRQFSNRHAIPEDIIWFILDPKGYLLEPDDDPTKRLIQQIRTHTMVLKVSRNRSLDDGSPKEENEIKEIFEEVHGTNFDNIPRQISALKDAGLALGSQFAQPQLDLAQLKRAIDFYSRIIMSFRNPVSVQTQGLFGINHSH